MRKLARLFVIMAAFGLATPALAGEPAKKPVAATKKAAKKTAPKKDTK